jgi:predicted Rossmann fold flavoprotein
MKNTKWIIIGAGATGLAAAINLARTGVSVTLLEQNSRVGKKILVSGNGRCNLSNRNVPTERFHSQDMGFVEAVLSGYGYESVEKFFASLGLPLVEEKEGKIFPVSMQASSVAELLQYEVQNAGANIVCDCCVTSVERDDGGFVLETTAGTMKCDHLLLASGSVAAPQLGGSDAGYVFAQKMGHSLIPRHPSLVQLRSSEKWVKKCAGVKTEGIAKLYANGEYVTEKRGDLLFVEYGISGLAILDISREVSLRLANFEYCELRLDLMPRYNKEQLTNLMQKFVKSESGKPIELWLHAFINKKLVPVILKQAALKTSTESNLNRKDINKLVHTLKNLPLHITDTRGFKYAEASSGGIDTHQVDPRTMESRIVPDLYFGGEILDVVGDRGGYNLHWAWVTGMRVAASRASFSRAS